MFAVAVVVAVVAAAVELAVAGESRGSSGARLALDAEALRAARHRAVAELLAWVAVVVPVVVAA